MKGRVLFTAAAIALLVCVVAPLATHADAPTDLHARVTATYSFRPRDLDENALAAKSAELDEFWSVVKGLGSPGLELLRVELGRDDAPSFFRYDGAKLLLSLSSAKADRELALRSVASADLRDIQLDDYFFTVHDLAVAGLDTTAAALHILDDPEFTVGVPAHALTLTQESCFIFLLLPTDESFYRRAVVERLGVETDPVATKTILTFLSQLATADADDAIRAFAADEKRPAELRQFAAATMRALEEMRSNPLGISPQSYESLKAERRRTAARVSDEAIYELQRQTLRIRRKQPR